jgi:serine/threonine protein kinase
VQVAQERSLREALVDFLLGVLDLDPQSRWTPRQALQHPFITGGIFQVRQRPQLAALVISMDASCRVTQPCCAGTASYCPLCRQSVP